MICGLCGSRVIVVDDAETEGRIPCMVLISSTTMSAKVTAIVNGVVGDHLDATRNELATIMGMYTMNGAVLDAATLGKATRVCIFVHGLTDNESVWSSSKTCQNYGELLQRDLGLLPIYVRYNTGLHVSTNGERLSELLNSLLLPDFNENLEIDFVCHSMGGLVTRSACLHATKAAYVPWVHQVQRIVFLGTPHHGSFWEKMGNVVSTGMAHLPFMRLASDVANLRSAGIKDLRYGYVQHEDWEGEDPDAFLINSKQVSELLPWVDYYIASGTITTNPNHPVSRVLGDALVRKDSAQGVSDAVEHTLVVPSKNIREFGGIGHLRLPNNPEVYEQLKEWMEAPCSCRSQTSSRQLDSSVLEESPPGQVEQRKTSSWAKAKGATTLLETAVEKGATGIEDLQDQITGIVYDTLAVVTPMPQTVRSVETIHSAISKGVFASIRLINYGVSTVAKTAFAAMDSQARNNSTTHDDV